MRIGCPCLTTQGRKPRLEIGNILNLAAYMLHMEDEINRIIFYLLDSYEYIDALTIQAKALHDGKMFENLYYAISELQELKVIYTGIDPHDDPCYLLKKKIRDSLLTRSDQYLENPYGYLIKFKRAGERKKLDKEISFRI
jgi:hypothetical protein